MNKALLVIAHGSRRMSSNQEVMQVTERLRQQLVATHTDYCHIDCAFLELAEPSIADGISHCLTMDVQHIDVLPYFLSAGRHVSEHIPDMIAAQRRCYPDVSIQILDHLGAAAQMPDLLASLANTT